MTSTIDRQRDPRVVAVLSDYGWLLRQAQRLVGRALGKGHSPEDLVQDVLAQALERPGTWSRSGKLRGWLQRALRNRAAELGRRASYRGTEALLDARAESKHSPSAIAKSSEEALRLRDLVLDLDPRARRVVLLRVVEDLSFGQIAREVGVREDHARAIFSRAAAEMRQRLAARAA